MLPRGKIKTRYGKHRQNRQNAGCQQHAQTFLVVERCDFWVERVLSARTKPLSAMS
jgi:hypothetical protein